MSTSLTFQDHSLEIINQNDCQWVKGSAVCVVLGYKNPEKAISDIYERNKTEFTPSMVQKIRISTNGGEQEVLAFSLRGAHLLAIFSRTPVSAQFRKWVLDMLEGQKETVIPETERITATQATKRMEKTHGDILKASEVMAHLATGKRTLPPELMEWLARELLRKITLSCACMEILTARIR